MNIFQSIKTYISRKKEEKEFKEYQQSLLTNKFLSICGRHKDQYIQSKGKILPNKDIETIVYTEVGPIRETIINPENSKKDFTIQYDGMFLEPNKYGEVQTKYGLIECSVNKNDESANISLFGGIFDGPQFSVLEDEFYIPIEPANQTELDISPETLREYRHTESERLLYAYSALKNGFDLAYTDENLNEKVK